MNTENQERRKYKRYDESFKRNAVELWLHGGKSVEQIARDLGISTQSLKQWKKQLAAWVGHPLVSSGMKASCPVSQGPGQPEALSTLHVSQPRIRWQTSAKGHEVE